MAETHEKRQLSPDAAINPSKIPNPRTTHLKSRSGCVTCKERRVKCDEGKPKCLRCIKFGADCGGYKIASTTKSRPAPRTRQLLPKGNGERWAIPSPSYPSRLRLGETEIENQYLQHFRDKTAPALAGPFDGDLWSQLILQAGQQELFVRHAITAIGALDKSLQMASMASVAPKLSPKDVQTPPSRDMAKLHREFALVEYKKSLRAMRVATSKVQANLRNVLIACLLVVCLENLLDNRHTALSHAQVGIRILQDWLASHPHSLPHKSGISSPVFHEIEDDLVLVFGRLDLQILTVSDTRLRQEHMAMKADSNATILNLPAAFSDLREAKRFLDLVMRRAYHFMSYAFIESDSQALSKQFEMTPPNKVSVLIGTNIHSTSNIIPEKIYLEQIVYTREISRWSEAFQPLFCRVQQVSDHKAGTALALLQIHHLATKIMLAGVIFNREMSYDQFEPEFREMLELMKLAMDNNGNDFNYWERGMSFQLGLASPLCLIVMRCRHRGLRREAISLLRSLPDEGAWEPGLIAVLGTWIMELEEEGVVTGIIPETSRAIFTRISEIPKGRIALFQCVKRTGGPDGGPVWYEKLVTW